MNDVDEFARRCRKRLGLTGLLQSVAAALQLGLAGSCALVLLERALSTGLGPFWAASLPLAGAVCVGIARGVAAWPGVLDAAVAVDTRLDLQERLSSALSASHGPMAGLVRADAARYVGAQDPVGCFPFAMAREGRRMALLAIGLAICLLVPEVDLLGWGRARAKRAGDARAVVEAVDDARKELRSLGRRAGDGGHAETARMLSECERRLLEMLQQDRHAVRRAAREAASELDARAAAGPGDAESRQLLVQAAEAVGRCAARLARETGPGEEKAAKGEHTRTAANPLVKAQEYDTARVSAREPEQAWLDACEAAASAMSGDAVPRRYRVAVRRYFAPDQPMAPSRRR